MEEPLIMSTSTRADFLRQRKASFSMTTNFEILVSETLFPSSGSAIPDREREPSLTIISGHSDVTEGELLMSSSTKYSLIEFIGEGTFGKVARCLNVATKEPVAVKIPKKDYEDDIENERFILEAISSLDPDSNNIIKFYEHFQHNGYTCLAFEMLDLNLFDYICTSDVPMILSEIRPVAEQLLVALDAIHSLGILHADIWPGNIMFVNFKNCPLKIKLIDFGQALPAANVEPGMLIQPVGYRAPEVSLGLPYSKSIDVWGAGCVMVFLYLGNHLFPVHCFYNMMRRIVEILGQPQEHLLQAGEYTKYWFVEEKAVNGPRWRLRTPEEYMEHCDLPVKRRSAYHETLTCLDDLVYLPGGVTPKGGELSGRIIFIDLLKQMLHLDGTERISPRQALQNAFFKVPSWVAQPSDSRPESLSIRNSLSRFFRGVHENFCCCFCPPDED